MDFSIKIKDYSQVVVGDVTELLPRLLPDKRVVVISDTNIDRYYHPLLESFDHILIGLGESSKTLMTADTIYRRFIELGVDRSTFILGIGGGIVTDITGFVASTFMRGVEFGFVSTSLLGQVDASVGGKNGVNVDGYKNMVGVFRQPRFVICDVNMLRTLPKREFRTGLAEIIKSAIIADKQLFEMLESADFSTLQQNTELLQQMVFRAISVKASIVERDECEAGDRRLLNLGHTLAHAIEKSSSKMNHGEAVAVGLSMICNTASSQGIFAENDRVQSLLTNSGFTLEPPVGVSQLMKAISKDKKAEGDDIHIVLPLNIGKCTVEKMPIVEFKALFSAK
ncbi:MAG: 3-dehydroquinate synthase [Alistipes sp.]|nr:3-dehydroquinate synthase [Alistipes sp.]